MKIFLKPLASLCCAALLLLSLSCSKDPGPDVFDDLKALPVDTGGEHKQERLDPAKNVLGHYTYLPGGYKANGPAYPLVVFLHGSGERGNSQNDPAALAKVIRNGIPKLIEKKSWKPEYPAIVVSPQCHDEWWNAKKIHDHITYLIGKYNINKERIYITGISLGAFGTYSYLEEYGAGGHAAAALPICGGGNTRKANAYTTTPVWAFHGDADNVVGVNKSIDMIKAINDQAPEHKAKLTIYPGVAHDSWSMTYDGTGKGKESKDYDPFAEDVFSWMFRYTKKQ